MVSVEKICLLCSEMGQCVPLSEPVQFVTDMHGPSVADLICELAQIDLDEEARWSTAICAAGCLSRLEICFQFLRQIRTAIGRIGTDPKDHRGKLVVSNAASEADQYELEYLEDVNEDEQTAGTCDKSLRDNMGSIRSFKLPQKSLIVTHLQFENFDYIEFRGERCCGCNGFFESLQELDEHSMREHEAKVQITEASSKCPVCKKWFSQPENLVEHRRYHATKEIFLCKLCQQSFHSKEALMLHIEDGSVHLEQNQNYQSVVSTEKIESPVPEDLVVKSDLIYEEIEPANDQCDFPTDEYTIISIENVDHQQQEMPAGTKSVGRLAFPCCFLKCSSIFSEETQLLHHVTKVHPARRKMNHNDRTSAEHVCKICLRNFTSKRLLQLHRNRNQKKRHICSYCGAAFLIPSKLQEHEKLVHFAASLPQHPCDQCTKVFRTVNLLKAHKHTHQLTREFSCDQCTAQFRFRFQLRKHLHGVHPKAFPYECSFCEKKFSTKPKHDLHLRSHTGEKPFRCRYETCGKQFSHGTDRKRHEVGVHEGERPHRCDRCPAAYLRKRELLIHSQKHQAVPSDKNSKVFVIEEI